MCVFNFRFENTHTENNFEDVFKNNRPKLLSVNVCNVQFLELFLSLDSWHVACQLPFMEVSMFISFKQ